MLSNRLGRTLALGVAAVAVFNTLAALSLPVRERRAGIADTALLAALLLAHAVLYWWGDRIRNRVGTGGYVAAQGAVVFLVGLEGALFPVGVGLYVALTVETVILAGQRWGTVPITLGAIALFGASAIAASDLYRGASAGLLLALTGVIAHAIGALVQRQHVREHGDAALDNPSALVDSAIAGATETRREPGSLTPREREVLRALASGARSIEIAGELGITERTVKAHLASIYQKLGVESRTAAVAAALQRGLT